MKIPTPSLPQDPRDPQERVLEVLMRLGKRRGITMDLRTGRLKEE